MLPGFLSPYLMPSNPALLLVDSADDIIIYVGYIAFNNLMSIFTTSISTPCLFRAVIVLLKVSKIVAKSSKPYQKSNKKFINSTLHKDRVEDIKQIDFSIENT